MLDQHALTRTKSLIVGYDFDDLFDPMQFRRDRATRSFEILIEAATPLPLDTAVNLWIERVRAAITHPITQEHLIAVFTKSLKQAQAKAAAKAKLNEEPFYYDGEPLVRAPRVIAVTLDAGRAPKGGANYTKADQHLAAYSRKELDADLAELVKRVKRVVSWFDRDEGSKYDMTGYIDYVTRGLASQLENKRNYLKRINEQMRDLERSAKNDSEFDERAWERLSSMRERVKMSGFMLKDALEAHELVRTDTYAYCGMQPDSFRSFAEMKKDRELHRKLKTASIDADKLVGLTPEEFAVWRKVTGHNAEGTLVDDTPNGGGVDALPDARTAASLRDVKDHAERQRRADARAAEDGRVYKRRKPRATPKKDAVVTPSGEPGSRYVALKQSQTG